MHSKSSYKRIATMSLAVVMILQPAMPILNLFTVQAEEAPVSFVVPEVIEEIVEPKVLEETLEETELLLEELPLVDSSIEVGSVVVTDDFNPFVDAFNFRISAPVTLVGLTDVHCYVTTDFNTGNPESSTWTHANFNGTECVSPLLYTEDGLSMNINIKATDGMELTDYGTPIERLADSAFSYFTVFNSSPSMPGYIPDTIKLNALAHDTVSPLIACEGRYRVVDGEWGEWMAGVITPNYLSGTCEVEITGLVEGNIYDFQVRVQDTVGHWQKSWSLNDLTVDNSKFDGEETDTMAPWVDTILENRSFNEGSVIPDIFVTASDNTDIAELCISLVSFNGDAIEYEPLAFDCIPDDGSVNTMYTWNLKDFFNEGGLYYFDTTVFLEGDYGFEYYVRDAAGNRSQVNGAAEITALRTEYVEESDVNYEVIFTVVNVKPAVQLLSDQTILEGTQASFTGSFEDPSCINIEGTCFTQGPLEHPDDADWIAIINYGDGSEETLMGDWSEVPGTIVIPNHVYANNGVYTATLTVCENTNNDIEAYQEQMFYKGCATACSTDEEAETYVNEYFNWYSEGECSYDTVQVTVTDTPTTPTNPGNDLVPTVVLFSNSPAFNNNGSVQVASGTTFTISANINNVGNPNYNFTFGGVCSGTTVGTSLTLTTSNAMNLSSGNYVCTVAISDVDGDVAVASVPVVVGSVLGIGNQAPGSNGSNGTNGDTNNDGTVDGNVEGSVDQVCEERFILAGNVFNDLDGDSTKDDNETGSAGVLVQVYYEDGLDEVIVAEETTSANGDYQFELCPGAYKVRISENDLPDGLEVLGSADKDVEIIGSDINDFNFVLTEVEGTNGGFNWWIFAILLLIIAGGTGVYLYTGRQPE
jgi:hypothetical protein